MAFLQLCTQMCNFFTTFGINQHDFLIFFLLTTSLETLTELGNFNPHSPVMLQKSTEVFKILFFVYSL